MCLSAYMYTRFQTELEICFVIHYNIVQPQIYKSKKQQITKDNIKWFIGYYFTIYLGGQALQINYNCINL